MGSISTILKGGAQNAATSAAGTLGSSAVGENGSDIKSDSSSSSRNILSDLGSMANDASNTVEQEANINNQMNHDQTLADESMDIEQALDKTGKKGFDNLAGMAP